MITKKYRITPIVNNIRSIALYISITYETRNPIYHLYTQESYTDDLHKLILRKSSKLITLLTIAYISHLIKSFILIVSKASQQRLKSVISLVFLFSVEKDLSFGSKIPKCMCAQITR